MAAEPVLFFCASVEVAVNLAESLGGKSLCSMSMDRLAEETQGFGSEYMVLTGTIAHIFGWGSPVPCAVYFLDGFPRDFATRVQAIARAERVSLQASL